MNSKFLCNRSVQVFAFTAKAVRICKLGQKNLPLAEGDLEWTDSVTVKPKAELLLILLLFPVFVLTPVGSDYKINNVPL